MSAGEANQLRSIARSIQNVCDERDALEKELGESKKTIDALLEEIKRLKGELKQAKAVYGSVIQGGVR